MTDKLSNLSGEAKQQFLDKTNGNVPSADELADHMNDLDIPEANVLTPVDLDAPFKGLGQSSDLSERETEGEIPNPAFRLDDDSTPLWSASSAFDEEQEAINQFLANKSRNIADYAGTSGGASSRAFNELRAQPTAEPKDLGLPADEEPKLLGGAIGDGGGIPFDANVDYTANTASNTGGFVSRMINYFSGKKEPQEEPEEEEDEPVIPQTTARGDLIFNTSSLKSLGIQQSEQFPQDTNLNTYRNWLRGEDSRVQPVEKVGGFDVTKSQVPSAFNWSEEASQSGANRVLSEARRIEQKVSAASLPKPPRVTEREPPDLGSVTGTYRRGNLEIPSTAPALPTPSDAESSTPLTTVTADDLVTLQPVSGTPQGESIPPSLTQQQGTTTSQLQEDQRLGAGLQGGALAQQALKKGREYFKSRKTRDGEDVSEEKPPPEEAPPEPEPQETAPSAGGDPAIDPPAPPSQPAEVAPPAEEAPAPAEEAPPAEEAAAPAEEGAEKATADVVEKGAEDVAEKGAEDIVPEIVPEATGGILDTIGAGLDATGVGAPLGILLGLGGILAGSGIFNKKPPTPPSATAVADNPEKFGLQVAPQEATVSQEVGGGNI